MALADDKLFIVWYNNDAVYGIIYGTDGKKLKDKFAIKSGLGEKCHFQATGLGEKAPGVNEYINPEIEAGGKNFLVTFKNGIFLYDLKTGQYVGEKSTGNCTYTIDYGGGYNYTWDSELSCVHDLAYGSGKFLAAVNNEGKFYDEDGNDAGCGTFGGHGDQFTTLAYGNNMFVGVVAIHLGTGDGIGASFMDSSGKHIIDTMPLEMAESPGYAAYDW
jgi:hypothetical protein